MKNRIVVNEKLYFTKSLFRKKLMSALVIFVGVILVIATMSIAPKIFITFEDEALVAVGSAIAIGLLYFIAAMKGYDFLFLKTVKIFDLSGELEILVNEKRISIKKEDVLKVKVSFETTSFESQAFTEETNAIIYTQHANFYFKGDGRIQSFKKLKKLNNSRK